MQVPLCFLRRSRGLCARVDRARARARSPTRRRGSSDAIGWRRSRFRMRRSSRIRRVSTRSRTNCCAVSVKVAWTATLRADQACRMGEALFAAAVRAGLRRVMVGVESGSQDTLDRLKKDMRLDQVLATAEMCARHDVGVIFNFIVGFPGEPEEQHRCDAAAGQAAAQHARPRSRPRSSITGRIPGTQSPNRRAPTATCFPKGLEAWADFDYVGERGPWVSAEAMAPGGALQVLHAARVAAGRVAVAAACRVALALRSRLVRVSRREGAGRARAATAAGVVMDLLLAHGYFLSSDAEEQRDHAAPPAARLALSVVPPQGARRRRRRLRRHVPALRGFRGMSAARASACRRTSRST